MPLVHAYFYVHKQMRGDGHCRRKCLENVRANGVDVSLFAAGKDVGDAGKSIKALQDLSVPDVCTIRICYLR